MLISKVPVDLRAQLASTILVTGGTSMLPGFITRLRVQLKQALSIPTPSSRHDYNPYTSLCSLEPFIGVINDPNPLVVASSSNAKTGRAPAFSPAILGWIGGSLAG